MAIGVAAIVTLRSIIQSVRTGLMREARTTLAADVLVQSNAAVDAPRSEPNSISSSSRASGRGANRIDRDRHDGACRSRARRSRRMVELRGVQAGYPFYGTLALQNGQSYSHALLENAGALVRPELLAQLGVEGRRQDPDRRPAVHHSRSDRSGAGAACRWIQPRFAVLIDFADMQRTGLLSFGSRANYQLLLKVRQDDADRLTRDVSRELRDRFVNARSFRSTEDQIGESLQRAENFLSLVGFIIVVLGGIGVWSVTRVFVRQKIRSVAILKCVGASTAQVLATYVFQVALLADGRQFHRRCACRRRDSIHSVVPDGVIRRYPVRSHPFGGASGARRRTARLGSVRTCPAPRHSADQTAATHPRR